MFQVRIHGRGARAWSPPGDLGLDDYLARMSAGHLLVFPATQLALEHLGRPMPGAPLLGGFAALTGQVRLDSVAAAIGERFSGAVAGGNTAAAAAACRFVDHERRAAGHAGGAQKG